MSGRAITISLGEISLNVSPEIEESDNHNLLQGTGKTMRHIRIKRMEDIEPAVFTSLIQVAM